MEWSQLGFPANTTLTVFDLWSKETTEQADGISALIWPHDVVMIKVSPLT